MSTQASMYNFYTLIKRKYDIPNPNVGIHHIELPARILIAGPSGSMKTNALMNLLAMFGPRTFHKLILCLKSADEPLYQHLIDSVPDEQIAVYEDGEVPPIDAEMKDVAGPKKKRLPFMKFVVFDDLLYDKQQAIKQYYIRGRKWFYTSCYVSQSYFQTPIDIRKNCQYIVLSRGLLDRDLNMIMRDFVFEYPVDFVIREYRRITQQPGSVMVFDTLEQEIRVNFTQPLVERHPEI